MFKSMHVWRNTQGYHAKCTLASGDFLEVPLPYTARANASDVVKELHLRNPEANISIQVFEGRK